MKYPFIIAIIFITLLGGGYLIKPKIGNNIPIVGTPNEKGGANPINNVGGKTQNLSGQGLSKAPDYIFNRTDTEELDLSNNSLGGALQSQVGQLKNLKILNLSNNKFTGVPAEVGQLKNLEILNLSNNQLTGLPNELGNLSKLKLLDLSGNNYSEQDLSGIRKNLPSTTIIKTQ